MGKPTDAAIWAQFEELQARGMSSRKIAAALGVDQRTVLRWRKRVGVSLGPVAARPQVDRDHVRQLLDDGCSIAEAARTVGVHPHTVTRWFPDAPRWTPRERGQMAALMRRMKAVEREMSNA